MLLSAGEEGAANLLGQQAEERSHSNTCPSEPAKSASAWRRSDMPLSESRCSGVVSWVADGLVAEALIAK